MTPPTDESDGYDDMDDHDDLRVPAALATLVRQAAADVPATDHDLGEVRRRARRQ